MDKSKWLFLHHVLSGAEALVPDLTRLSPLDRLVFREVISCDRIDQPLTVSCMLASELASPATLHASMKRLLAAKLIGTKSDPSDARLRYLVQTPKSEKLLAKLEDALQEIGGGLFRLAESTKKTKPLRRK